MEIFPQNDLKIARILGLCLEEHGGHESIIKNIYKNIIDGFNLIQLKLPLSTVRIYNLFFYKYK